MAFIPEGIAASVGKVYAYSPYGETVALGPDEGNPLQYTGRENDGTGLYYYRARYYDPVLKRFIGEDPIGIAGGINIYSYVKGNPVSRLDPSGNVDFEICVTACIATAVRLCFVPGFPQLLCAACALLPPPAAAACLGVCLSTPIVNCVGILSAACIVGCGTACYVLN